MSDAGRGLRAALANTALVVASCVLTALVVEGSASAYLFGRDVMTPSASRVMVRPHTMPDTLLGWANRAGFTSANEYGKGIGLATDAQGFRGTRTLSATVPKGGVRIVCSGDAFTMGYGVDDAHPWCARLEAELPGVETINLGQAAYGLDQSLLRYERDGVRYGPQLQFVEKIWHGGLLYSSLSDSDEGPIERHGSDQQQRVHRAHHEAESENILRAEVSV